MSLQNEILQFDYILKTSMTYLAVNSVLRVLHDGPTPEDGINSNRLPKFGIHTLSLQHYRFKWCDFRVLKKGHIFFLCRFIIKNAGQAWLFKVSHCPFWPISETSNCWERLLAPLLGMANSLPTSPTTLISSRSLRWSWPSTTPNGVIFVCSQNNVCSLSPSGHMQSCNIIINVYG